MKGGKKKKKRDGGNCSFAGLPALPPIPSPLHQLLLWVPAAQASAWHQGAMPGVYEAASEQMLGALLGLCLQGSVRGAAEGPTGQL